MTTIITVFVVLIAVFVLIWATGNNSNEKEIERLKLEYESALSGTHKKVALKAGRLYYAIARKNKALTIFDEMAIANDLSTMPQEVYLPTPSNNDVIDQEIPKSSASTIINY